MPERTMHSHSQPEVSDDSRYFSLHEYAEKFKNGILDAHAKAFDPDVQQDQPLCQNNYGCVAVTPSNQASQYQSPYPILGPDVAFPDRLAQPDVTCNDHHYDYHDPTAINPHAPTHATHLAVPGSSSHHHTYFPSPPPSTGLPSPEQPHHARLPHSSTAAANHHGNPHCLPSPSPSQSSTRSGESTYGVCCGTSYGSKYTFTRHQRESRTCPYGTGGRSFLCYLCANTDQLFTRRTSLKQHVEEKHHKSKKDAKMEVDTWYGRYGEEKDYPEAVMDLDGLY